MKTICNTTFKAAVLLLFVLSSTSAWAANYISDVMVIGGSKTEVNNLKSSYTSKGWKVIDYDLNKGCGSESDYVFMLYKTTDSSDDGAYITDFYLREGKNPPGSLTHNGRTYTLASYDGGSRFKDLKGDLNSNAGGDYIHVYYTKQVFSDFRTVTGITFNTTKSGAVGKNGGSDGYDLNAGCGSGTDYIYMHVTTKSAPISGIGTENNPYVIRNLEGWNTFANNVQAGNNYSGKFVELGNNISGASVIAGTATNAFSGHFDGKGKTLNVSINSTLDYSAPFYKINNATILNLKVTGNISSSKSYSGGLVGWCIGETNKIEGCVVEAAVSGNSNIGGIVGCGTGVKTDALYIKDCIFSGTLSVGYANGIAAGLIGRCFNMLISVNNCLVKGTLSGTGFYHPIDACWFSDIGTVQVVDTYYLNSIDISNFPADNTKANGIAVNRTFVKNDWENAVNAVDGNTYYAHIKYKTIGSEKSESQIIPFTMDKNYSLTQQIYLADEIGMECDISSITFEYAGTVPFFMSGVQVYMKHTNQNQFCTSNDILTVNEADKMFEGTFFALESGLVNIELNKPFHYDGYSNLLVCCYDPTNGSVGNLSFYQHETDSKKSISYHDDSAVPDLNSINNYSGEKNNYSMRNNVRFNIIPSIFPIPTNLLVNNIDEETVMVTWKKPETGQTIINYAYQYKKSDDSTWSNEVTTTSTSITINRLTANTTYDFRVKIRYSSGESTYRVTHFTSFIPMPLPYYCDFENGLDRRWSQQNCFLENPNLFYTNYSNNCTGLSKAAGHDSNSCFIFVDNNSNSRNTQSLISPGFGGTEPITLSFYFGAWTWETFQVGYSTTTNDIDAFTWVDEGITPNKIWLSYEKTFPVGTKYIAVKYTSNSVVLYLDDFNFTVYTGPKPTDVAVEDYTETSATLTWKTPSSDKAILGYAYQYKKLNETTWSKETTTTGTSATLSGLTANTEYEFRVKTLLENNESSTYAIIDFFTAMSLPYYCDFENGLDRRWSQQDCYLHDPNNPDLFYTYHSNNFTGLSENIGHDSNNCFIFSKDYRSNTKNPQYLISPKFGGTKPITFSFYFGSYSWETFQVGYSTTTNDIDAFTWGDDIASPNKIWIPHDESFPVGTKYIAIKYISNSVVLYLDDFSFTVYTGPKPTDVTVEDNTDTSATLRWKAPSSDKAILGYAYQYKKLNETTWSKETTTTGTSVILSGLTANADYEFRVKTLFENNESSTYAIIDFFTAMDLPYCCDFENGLDRRWSQQDCNLFNPNYPDLFYTYHSNDYTGLCENIGHDSNNCFIFSKDYRSNTKNPQYLISPKFGGTKPITFSFYFGSYSWETFQVGYSTTTNDIDAFTWGDDIASPNKIWIPHDESFPVGTKYIAIKYISNSVILYLDDFSFTVYTGPKPADLTLNELSGNMAKLTWKKPSTTKTITGYAYQYKKANEHNWSTEVITAATSVTLNNLLDRTDYEFRVKTLYGDKSSTYAMSYFTTAVNLPYDNGFEEGLDGWTLVDCNMDPGGEIDSELYSGISSNAHSGDHAFHFTTYSYIPQYLISPRLPDNVPIGMSCYYKNSLDEDGISYLAHFQVGYSTTTNDISEFKWYSEILTSQFWTFGTINFPEGTKYVAIKWLKNSFHMYIDDFHFTSFVDIPLANAADNTSIIINSRNKEGKVTLNDRTLYRSEKWNTLCLPFDLSNSEVNTFLYNPSKLMTLSSSLLNNGTLTLNFTEANTIEAGKPYIIKWNSGSDLINPYFFDVNIPNNYSSVDAIDNALNTKSIKTNYANFVGMFSPKSLSAGDKTIVYLGDDNVFHYPSQNMTIGSCRAYLQLPGKLVDPSKGDVNGDESISIADVMAMVNYILTASNNNFIIKNGDVNGDGQISVADVMELVNMIIHNRQIITNIVIKAGDETINYNGGGSKPARIPENIYPIVP